MTLNAACKDMLSAISAYLDGDLDATQCVEIERHCATCPQCADVVGALRQTVGLCHEAATVPLPDAVRVRAQESIQRLLAGERGK